MNTHIFSVLMAAGLFIISIVLIFTSRVQNLISLIGILFLGLMLFLSGAFGAFLCRNVSYETITHILRMIGM